MAPTSSNAAGPVVQVWTSKTCRKPPPLPYEKLRVNTNQRFRVLNGKGRKSTASTTVKIAVFAPIPSAEQMIAVRLKPGYLRSERTAYRTWPMMVNTNQTELGSVKF